MPRVTVVQSNFTAGEISPKLYGRSDLARYLAGAKTVTNGVVQQHGGIRRRDGSVYVAGAGGTGRVRLIRYVFSRSEAYCLEFGENYIRFFNDDGAILDSDGNVYELATTYSQSELFDLSYTQAGSIMFIAHRDHPLAKLERLDVASWSIGDVEYTNQPVKEDIWKVPFALTIDNPTVGTNRVMTCPMFRTADYRIDEKGVNVSRKIYSSGGGEATITGNVLSAYSPVQHTVTIDKAFESTTINPVEWWMDGQPQCALTIASAALTAGTAVTLTYGTTAAGRGLTGVICSTTTYYGRPAAVLTATNHTNNVPRIGDIIKITKSDGAVLYFTCVSFTGTGTIGATVKLTFQVNEGFSADGFSGAAVLLYYGNSYTASGTNMATTEDIGSIISVNSGYVKVTAVTENQYIGTIVKTLSSGASPGPNAWAIMRPAWTGDSGYPATVTSYEQRLVVSGTAFNPSTVWFSRIGNFYDFLPGSLDDDALSVTISGSEQADIVHLMQGKALVALASNGEYTFAGGVEKPITPTNIQIRNQSVYGCSSVRPQRIGNELYFVQRAGKKVRAFTYKYESDDFGAPDLSIMSEHLTGDAVVDMAYCPEPESVMWIVRSDGGMASVTIERENDVIAWCNHATDGLFESVCSVPNSTSDTLWISVNRDGVRSIERMASGVYLDSAVQGSSVTPVTDWSGLSHLEGKTVSVVADGSVVADVVVSGGAITLTEAASDVVIGLPYTTTIETLMQDFGTGTGSIHGNSNRVGEVSIRFLETTGCTINGSEVTFRRYDTDILDASPATFTGLHRIEKLGWDRGDVSITIEQTNPLPFHVQQVIYKFTSND